MSSECCWKGGGAHHMANVVLLEPTPVKPRLKFHEEPAHGRREETYTSAFVSDRMVNLLMETQGRLPCTLTDQRDSSFKRSKIKEGIS